MYNLENNFSNQAEALSFVITHHMSSVVVLDHTSVGKTVYLLCEVVPTVWLQSYKYIAVLHFSNIKGEWSCVEYDETMNPTQFLDCPIKYFEQSDLRSEQSQLWHDLSLENRKTKLSNKKTLQTKIGLLEENFRSRKKIMKTSKFGILTIIDFHSNSKSQIIARNEDGVIFRYKLLDISIDEIKNI